MQSPVLIDSRWFKASNLELSSSFIVTQADEEVISTIKSNNDDQQQLPN